MQRSCFAVLFVAAFIAVAAVQALTDHDIDALVARMTLQEKIGQMSQLDIGMLLKDNSADELDEGKLAKAIKEYGIGSFLNSPFSGQNIPKGWDVAQWRRIVDQIQNYTLRNTQHKIPAIYGLDSVHGAVYVYGATLFPHNFAVAASYNLDLAGKMASITAKDTRAAGVPWSFAPVLDAGVQPLWPRFYETFGEDPYTITQFAKVIADNTQGSNMSNPFKLAGTAKHFIGYSAPRNGKDRTDAWVPEHYLRQYFLPPFEEAFKSGIASVMVNSASLNGIPIHADRHLLKDVLRKELGFEGVVVTDWQDIEKLNFYHLLASSPKEAVAISVEAGIDMSMIPSDFSFCDFMVELVNESVITEERIDESVRRILRLKRDVGLFESPLADPSVDELLPVGGEADRQVSLDLARESITLLKNANLTAAHESQWSGPVLPLSNWLSEEGTILVVGPTAHSITNQCGGWSVHWQGAASDSEFTSGTTLLQSVRAFAEPRGVNVLYTKGTSFSSTTEKQRRQALKLAREADVIILAVGEGPYAESLGNIDDLTISEPQLDLYRLLNSTGVPIVTVLIEGRPRVLNDIADSTGLVMAYLPCTEGGQAISEVLFGQVNPSGRLPFTYPRTTGDIDVYYHKPWGTYSQGTDTSFHTPLYDFGHGLSYTSFAYSDLSVHMAKKSAYMHVSVRVKNTGLIAGKQTVMLFVTQDYRRQVTPETRMLKAFKKISLDAGESRVVKLRVSRADLTYVSPITLERVLEAGSYTVRVADLKAQVTLELESED